MKKPRRSFWITTVPVLAAALFFAVRAESDPEPATTATATAASASASASAPEPPPLKGADLPAETSDQPKEKEWETGKKVRALRDASAVGWRSKNRPCTLTLVREWLRLRCVDRIGAVLVTGDKADVTIAATGDLFSEQGSVVTITTRVQRGETKIFTLLGLRGLGDYGGFSFDSDEPIAVAWRDGREDPIVLIGAP